ncbi:hypothetical protein OG884_26655 [Streptosporangium sp. NBC_01755]|uniref:hypothetical protein n=1 Tax=Streptosporangium sp. NBC_01755 TaxID=2975949 RepID=UPI002DD88289|nr:hypothetical protein [Streptosporangium sp. NBC_01755]WSC98431.1 hypothetical protein OG884_26655 [Streptosporangium sp. NBC_01755]
MILDWFRTTKALTAELEEVREECAALASERDELAEKLAQAERDRDSVWRALAVEETRPLPALTADARAEVQRERERADALEKRLHTLQVANMRHDVRARCAAGGGTGGCRLR